MDRYEYLEDAGGDPGTGFARSDAAPEMEWTTMDMSRDGSRTAMATGTTGRAEGSSHEHGSASGHGDGNASRSAGRSAGGDGLGEPPPSAGIKGVIACLSCRRQKIKCFPPEAPATGPCRRCVRMDLACDYVKHNRGRKKKVRSEGQQSDSQRKPSQEWRRQETKRTAVDRPQSSSGYAVDNGRRTEPEDARYDWWNDERDRRMNDRDPARPSGSHERGGESGVYTRRSPAYVGHDRSRFGAAPAGAGSSSNPISTSAPYRGEGSSRLATYAHDRTFTPLEGRHFPFLPLPVRSGPGYGYEYDRPMSAGSAALPGPTSARRERSPQMHHYGSARRNQGREDAFYRHEDRVEEPYGDASRARDIGRLPSPDDNYLPPLRAQPRGSIFSLRSMLHPFAGGRHAPTSRSRSPSRRRERDRDRMSGDRDGPGMSGYDDRDRDADGSIDDDRDLPESYESYDEEDDDESGTGVGLFASKPTLGPDVRDDDVERQVPTGLPTASALRAAQERARAQASAVQAKRPAIEGAANASVDYAHHRKRRRSGDAAGAEENDRLAPRERHDILSGGWVDVQGKDPLDVGLLEEGQAKELFKLFMTELNTAAGILDPDLHTFEYVKSRSAFLTSAILCVATRYDTSSPATDIHRDCLRMARNHQTLAFAEAQTSLEIVQAVTILAVWKEPEDDRAAFYFNRAVVMARELRLDKIHPSPEVLSKGEQSWYHARQRIWLCLFIINTIYVMQFDQSVTIQQDDPLVMHCLRWFDRSNQPLMDMSMVASVSLRRKFLQYRDLLQKDPDTSIGRAVSLNVLGRTMSRDLDRECRFWTDRIKAFRNGIEPVKPYIWCGAIKLHLNALLLNQCMRLPMFDSDSADVRDQSLARMAATPGFHDCLEASCEILQRMDDVPVKQISYASDTWLHFTVYAAFFLHSLLETPIPPTESRAKETGSAGPTLSCGGPSRRDFQDQSIISRDDCTRLTRLIARCADLLDRASLQRLDSPALHARFLQHLVDKLQRIHRSGTAATQAPITAGGGPAQDPYVEQERPQSSNGPPSARLAALQDAHMAWSTPLVGQAQAILPLATSAALEGDWAANPSATAGLAMDLGGPVSADLPAIAAGDATRYSGDGTNTPPAQVWSGDMGGSLASIGGGIWSQLGGVWFDHVMQDMAQMGPGNGAPMSDQAARQQAAGALQAPYERKYG